MVKMVPYEAFACPCGGGDVVLQESYKPKTRGASRNAECSNCKHLLDKITILEATVEIYKNPEQHTLNSAALLHEVYNDMEKVNLE
uniref:Uncharacterized protein n=1 Tax=Tanacetum cinerariifolium TaxID=118510 RepID=A0A6L2MMR8_TANCI|nr:hypothetical protein [Tanacetum cinerariifolium]